MLLKVDTAELLQLAEAFEVAAEHLQTNRPVVLEAVGVQNVSWAMQDYRVKSRGGRGDDGAEWEPIQDETVKNRIRHLQSYRAKSAAIGKAKRSIRNNQAILATAMEGIRRSVRGSAKYKAHAKTIKTSKAAIVKQRRTIKQVKYSSAGINSPQKKAIQKTQKQQIRDAEKTIKRTEKQLTKAKAARAKLRDVKTPKEHGRIIARLEAKLGKAKDAKKKFINTAIGSAKIGVDTGRQVNALTFGVPALQGKGGKTEPFNPRPGNSDPVPNAIFNIGEGFVTVGVNTSYAKQFDESRQIFGDLFHHEKRRQKLEQIAAKANEILLRQAAEKIKVGSGSVSRSDLEREIE